MNASGVIVLRDDVSGLLTIIHKGRKLIRIIRENYAWAIAFNTAGIALATAGFLSPWPAALFHHISSVLVVLNSARLVHDTGAGGNGSSKSLRTPKGPLSCSCTPARRP